jgi:endo-1,4-beta-D-glucanase Y
MSWKISRHDTVLEKESATEADQNVALALLLASKQWGSSGLVNYYEEANRLVDKILSGEVEAKSYVLKPGADWGGYSITNPAYLAPAAYRLFERFNNDWAKVLDRSYKIYDLFYERQATGLMPDWTVADGSTSYRGNNYTYDACQIPLKIGQDYLWNGQGGKYLDKISYWIVQQSGSNPAAIVDGYKLDGTPIGKYNNAAFVGPLAIAAMSAPKYQTWLDMLYEHLVKIETGGHWGYYSDTLRLVSLLVLTGNFPNFWQTLPEPEEWLKG